MYPQPHTHVIIIIINSIYPTLGINIKSIYPHDVKTPQGPEFLFSQEDLSQNWRK